MTYLKGVAHGRVHAEGRIQGAEQLRLHSGQIVVSQGEKRSMKEREGRVWRQEEAS